MLTGRARKVRLSAMENQSEFFANKVMDLANLVAAGLFFGPFVAGKINWISVIIGFSFYVLSLMLGLHLTRRMRK